MPLNFRYFSVSVLLIATLSAPRAGAVILADKTYRNKSAPTGSLANSGWQWQGNWGAFTGTAIGKNYFMTASHVGGSVGQSLTLGGKNYTTTAVFDDPNSDLRIWKTSSSFSSWAPLNTSTGEVGKTAILFGRGTARGSEIQVNGTTHGWYWGSQDGKLSWGQNKVSSIIDGGAGIGKVLSYTFDRKGKGDFVSNEGTVSAGDSSGGVFVNSSGKWRLAAINYSTDGPFSLTSGGSSFLASLYDKGGLYEQGRFITDGVTDVPARFYSTRISANQAWIYSILNGGSALGAVVPEPGGALALLGAVGCTMRRRKSPQMGHR